MKIVPGALNFQLIPGYAALEKALRQKSRATHLCLLEVGCWQLPELSSVGGLLQGHLGGGYKKHLLRVCTVMMKLSHRDITCSCHPCSRWFPIFLWLSQHSQSSLQLKNDPHQHSIIQRLLSSTTRGRIVLSVQPRNSSKEWQSYKEIECTG